MNIFFEPQNVKQWNIFENVKNIGHVEPFLATKEMCVGDCVLLYVGQQSSKYKPGVYAIGKVVRAPYFLRNRPNDYCNNKLSVDVKITYINYVEPIIDYYHVHSFNKQYRTVHKLNIADKNILKTIQDKIDVSI